MAENKGRVLFVDDEPKILQGLRRSLRKHRSRWDMDFAQSGRKALESMERDPADVVVTDMKMPGMSGMDLLEEVRSRWPESARVMLTGHTDPRTVFKSVQSAHRFLGKPCPTKTLARVVESMFALKDVLGSRPVRRLLSSMETVPLLPQAYRDIRQELTSDNPDMPKVAEVVSLSPGLSASILRMANSPFFGFARTISNIRDAVVLLGTEIVSGLVLSSHIFSIIDVGRHPLFSPERLRQHSQNTAWFAMAIATVESQHGGDSHFVAGLLHDIGKLVIADQLPEAFSEILALCQENNSSTLQAEKEVLGVSHAEVGAYLLGLWGMDHLQEAVAQHHRPGRNRVNEVDGVTILHAANVLEHRLNIIHRDYAEHPLDEDHLHFAGALDRVGVWRDACEEALKPRDQG